MLDPDEVYVAEVPATWRDLTSGKGRNDGRA
jgi:hypothetical protein